MFELTKTNCKSASTSKNSENMGAGGETRQGVSLYFEFDANNETLDMLDPKLRPAFYERAANDAQEDITGHMPVRKFELKKPLELPWVGMGYKVALHADLEFSTDFELPDCKIDNIKVMPKADGIVGWRFRVYCHPMLRRFPQNKNAARKIASQPQTNRRPNYPSTPSTKKPKPSCALRKIRVRKR